MGIVRFALRFPHTFYVLAALIVFLGGIAIYDMRTDIFPEIRIPVVSVIWSYSGLSTPEVEQRITTYSQYSISSSVNGIKNMEAQSFSGLSVQRIYFLGETLNTMTLGGLPLAVGILVDDSTVTIENTHRLRTEEGMALPQATLHGSAGIAVPTMVSTLAISCVFTSVVFLEGPAKYLFTPLGLAVVFAMLASYALSRTLTPIAIGLLLRGEHHGPQEGASWGVFSRFHATFERVFERMRQGYARLLTFLLNGRIVVPVLRWHGAIAERHLRRVP